MSQSDRDKRRCRQYGQQFAEKTEKSRRNLSYLNTRIKNAKLRNCTSHQLGELFYEIVNSVNDTTTPDNLIFSRNHVVDFIVKMALSDDFSHLSCDLLPDPVHRTHWNPNTCHLFALKLFNAVSSHKKQPFHDVYKPFGKPHDAVRYGTPTENHTQLTSEIESAKEGIFLINFELDDRGGSGHTFCVLKIDGGFWILQSDQIMFSFREAVTALRALDPDNDDVLKISEFELLEILTPRKVLKPELFVDMFFNWDEDFENVKIAHLYFKFAPLDNNLRRM